MKILVTGASSGIGLAICKKMLTMGNEVHGIDLNETELFHPSYYHHIADVCKPFELPEIDNVDAIVTCAGTDIEHDTISVNFYGVHYVITKYCTDKETILPCDIVNICSASAHNGSEFPLYVASKGAVLAYTKYIANTYGKYGVVCNSISPGGVITPMTAHIYEDDEKRDLVLDETLLGKWAFPQEIAKWVEFLLTSNESMTGQDILIDNGEMLKSNFIW